MNKGEKEAVSLLKRISRVLLVGLLPCMCLMGCGEEAANVSAVTIDQEGKIESVLIEEFDKDYYDVKELSAMTEEEISEYNSLSGSARIVLESAEAIEDSSFVKLTMSYESAEDYAAFNETDFFFGTLREAENAGYNISKRLVNGSGDKIDDSFADDNPDRHIIITGDKVNIIAPFNIEYMSEGVLVKDKKEAVLEAVTKDSVQLLLSK